MKATGLIRRRMACGRVIAGEELLDYVDGMGRSLSELAETFALC